MSGLNIGRRFCALGLAILTLAACGTEAPEGPQPEFIPLKGLNIYVMIIPPASNAGQLKPWAKDRCGEVSFCKVFGWTDRATAARALPMTDAEYETLAFQYSVNRATGYESAALDCDQFTKTEGLSCF